MKKVLVILMTLVMVFAVTACGNNEGASSNGEMIDVCIEIDYPDAAGVADVKDIHNVKMRVEYDGGVIEGKFVFGTVSNSLSVGGFIKLPDDKVKFNDGKFEVILVKDFKPYKILSTMYKTMTQKYIIYL